MAENLDLSELERATTRLTRFAEGEGLRTIYVFPRVNQFDPVRADVLSLLSEISRLQSELEGVKGEYDRLYVRLIDAQAAESRALEAERVLNASRGLTNNLCAAPSSGAVTSRGEDL